MINKFIGFHSYVKMYYSHIYSNGCKLKKRHRKRTFNFNDHDITIIDDLIIKFYDNKTVPTRKDLFYHIKDNNINVSFKKCSIVTFHRIIKRIGYKIK